MRLRQIALATNDLDAVVSKLCGVLGLKVSFVDPSVAAYGLRNAVLPTGTGFLEVVEPTTAEASAARFLARRGGEAGYMLILQCADAEAERARAAGLGVRVIEDIDTQHYRSTHFHPRDFGGVLVSFDQQRSAADHLDPFGAWAAGGPGWRSARTEQVRDIVAATISSADPDALLERWAQLLGVPADPADQGRLVLGRGELRFARAAPDAVTRISEILLRVDDRRKVLSRARERGCLLADDTISIAGVGFRLIE